MLRKLVIHIEKNESALPLTPHTRGQFYVYKILKIWYSFKHFSVIEENDHFN